MSRVAYAWKNKDDSTVFLSVVGMHRTPANRYATEAELKQEARKRNLEVKWDTSGPESGAT